MVLSHGSRCCRQSCYPGHQSTQPEVCWPDHQLLPELDCGETQGTPVRCLPEQTGEYCCPCQEMKTWTKKRNTGETGDINVYKCFPGGPKLFTFIQYSHLVCTVSWFPSCYGVNDVCRIWTQEVRCERWDQTLLHHHTRCSKVTNIALIPFSSLSGFFIACLEKNVL